MSCCSSMNLIRDSLKTVTTFVFFLYCHCCSDSALLLFAGERLSCVNKKVMRSTWSRGSTAEMVSASREEKGTNSAPPQTKCFTFSGLPSLFLGNARDCVADVQIHKYKSESSPRCYWFKKHYSVKTVSQWATFYWPVGSLTAMVYESNKNICTRNRFILNYYVFWFPWKHWRSR